MNKKTFLYNPETNTIRKVSRQKDATPTVFAKELENSVEYLETIIDKRAKSGLTVLEFKRVKKRLFTLKKLFPKMMRNSRKRKDRPEGSSKIGGFNKKYRLSADLCNFLKVKKFDLYTPSEIMSAIGAYIHISPEENRSSVLKWKYLNEKSRDLRDKNDLRVINPDKKLSELLKYEQYKEEVRNGDIKKRICNKNTGEKSTVLVEDEKLYRYVINKLIYRHFLKE